MTASQVLPIAVVAPLSGAALSMLGARLSRKLPLVIGVAALIVSVLVLSIAASQVYDGHGRLLVEFFSNEHPVHGQALGIAFAADPFGLTFALLTASMGTLLLVALQSEFAHIGKHELGSLAALAQLLLAALMAAALTADTVNLFVWFEVAALASYGLTGFFLERPVAVEAAFKMLVLTSLAGFMVFIGAGMLYADRGALNFGQLHQSMLSRTDHPAQLALALIVAGFATKAGVMPFHGWLPDAHPPVPGPISALFSGLMVNLGLYGIVRIAIVVYSGHRGHVLGLLTVLGLVSAILGAVLALAQDDLKRLLAWDTVSQLGIVLVGLASASDKATTGAVYHLVNHGLFKALLFLCAGAIVHATGETTLSNMGGLLRLRPVTTVAFTFGALSISGVPPFNGFASLGLLHEGLREHRVVYAGALIAQVVTVAALGRAAYLGFYRRREEPYEHMERSRTGMRVATVSLMTACVGFGVFAEQFVTRVAGPAASGLLHPNDYAAAVLAQGGAVPASHVSFSYATGETWWLTAVEVVLGVLLAAGYLRMTEPRPVRWLRAVHTGSVNDYAAYATGGFLVAALVLIR